MSSVDQKTRARVICSGSSFIVQAPAGSGKTELLTQRFLNLLAMVDRPERVLAITFTRKATQEMRERIMHRLQQAREGFRPRESHERQAVDLAGRVLARSKDQQWELLDNPGRLQIHTIDGLCARIEGRAARPGAGNCGLTVMEDASPLYLKAARRLIEDMGRTEAEAGVFDALARVLTYLQGSASELQKLLSSMLARRDQWMGLTGHGAGDMLESLSRRQRLELDLLGKDLGQERLELLTDSLCSLAHDARDRETAENFLRCVEAVRKHPDDTGSCVRLAHLSLKLVATTRGEPYAPGSVKSRVLPAQELCATGAREVIGELLSVWRNDDSATAAFARFVRFPPVSPDARDRSILGDFILLLRYAAAELRVLFVEQGRMDFIHVAESALRSLGDCDRPGEALLAEDNALEHLLMDEFQDTSRVQYELVKKLISGWQPGDGRSLFLVGDPMQSIYRFRQADVSLFNHVFRHGCLGDVALEKVRLESNFRARRELIDWVNGNFSRVFGAPGRVTANFIGYTPFRAELEGGGRVAAHPCSDTVGPEGEAGQVADLIAGIVKERPEASVAVLARTRKQLGVIAGVLRDRRMEFEAVQVETLANRPVITDLLSILRAIVHPGDRIAWLSLLRAPWCALTPDELLTVAGTSGAEDIRKRMADPEVQRSLNEGQRTRLKLVHDTLAAVVGARHRVKPSRLVEVAWLRLKGPCTVGSAAELDNAEQFFRLLEEIEANDSSDLVSEAHGRVKTLFSAARQSAVKLMTIHKAKGLEFDVVVLPGLHRSAGRPGLPFLRMADIDHGIGALVAPRRRRGPDGPGLYEYLGALEAEEEASEAARVLYVAATRAREQLHLFGAWKWDARNEVPGCREGTFMHMLWPSFEQEIYEAEAPVRPKQEATGQPQTFPQLYMEGEPSLGFEIREERADYDRELPELRLIERDRVALGLAYHRWMQLIHDHWEMGWDAAFVEERSAALASSLQVSGAAEENIEALTKRLQGLILKTLADETGRSVASPESNISSWSEIMLVQREGMGLQRHILDRLLVDCTGEVVVVDYKTGVETEDSRLAWDAQLSRYAKAIRDSLGAPVSKMSVYNPETRPGARV